MVGENTIKWNAGQCIQTNWTQLELRSRRNQILLRMVHEWYLKMARHRYADRVSIVSLFLLCLFFEPFESNKMAAET